MGSVGDSVLIVAETPATTATLYEADGVTPVWEGDLPFGEPIAFPHVTALDDGTYIVTGVPCTSASIVDDSGPTCQPGGVAVSRLDPVAQTINAIEVRGVDGETAFVGALGVSGSMIVVQVGDELYQLPAVGGELVSFAPRPMERLDLACVDDGLVLAVGRGDPAGNAVLEPGEQLDVPYAPFVPFEVSQLDLETGQWTHVGGPDAVYDLADTFELSCVEGGVLAVPSERPISDTSPYVSYRFDQSTQTWSELPPPPREFLSASPAATNGQQVALSVSSDLESTDTAVLVFSTATDSWVEVPGGEGVNANSMVLSDQGLLSITEAATEPVMIDLGA